MEKLAIAKFAANAVACAGTSKIVKEIIANNVTVETKIDKITVWAASFVIAGMAKNATREYTSARIDQTVAWVNKQKQKLEESKTDEVTV